MMHGDRSTLRPRVAFLDTFGVALAAVGASRWMRPASALMALACALVVGAAAAQQSEERERGAAERNRHRQELREQLRDERLRPPDPAPGDPSRRGGRDASHLSPDERQALRQQLREQPPWRGQR